MNQYKWAVTALIGANLIWGSTFVIVKESVNSVDTFVIAFMRCLIASTLLGSYILIKSPKILLEKKSIIYGSILGLILASIYISQAYALNFTTSSHSAFITVSSTLLTAVIMVFFFKAKENWKGWLSIIIAFIGVYFLSFKQDENSSDAVLLGDFITFLAAIVCAYQLIYSGRFVKRTNFLSLIFYQFFVASLIALIGIAIFPDAKFEFPDNSIYFVSYLGLFGTLYCYFVTVWAQKYVSTITTAMIFSMEPIFASTFSYIHFNEVFGYKELIGAILILIGVLAYQLKDQIKLNKA